jgi:DNA-binding MarR family transcriptional regulator
MAAGTTRSTEAEKTRIMLGVLDSVQRGEVQSQRRLASELGIALGLVNAYLKRCVNKGLVKVSTAPAKRYAYYLTPGGFAEKSRLTVEYLSHSFSLFRQAKTDFCNVLAAARADGIRRIAFLGVSDLAEVAAICALDCGMTIVAAIDEGSELTSFVGVPVVHGIDDLGTEVDAIVVTDMKDTLAAIEAATARFGAERVLVPALLDVRAPATKGGRA